MGRDRDSESPWVLEGGGTGEGAHCLFDSFEAAYSVSLSPGPCGRDLCRRRDGSSGRAPRRPWDLLLCLCWQQVGGGPPGLCD